MVVMMRVVVRWLAEMFGVADEIRGEVIAGQLPLMRAGETLPIPPGRYTA